MTVEANKETLNFQAEVRQLLDLMIHSLYSNKEIFLRELVSNASDACDKLRFEALSNEALFEGDAELKIRVSFDKAARTLTIADNGIGMTRDEIVDNIGTIARSGTRQFFDSLTGDQAKDAKLIGQFGVGFYSAFIVADRVTLLTRRAGLASAQAVRWESDGQGSFSLEYLERPQRGTEVVLHLREGEDEFLDGLRLRTILRKYSDHISLPILMPAEGKEGEYETVNRASALWARSKSEISEQEYAEFYKHVAHDFEEPLARVHSRVEGRQAYTLLLYIPRHAPFDLWDRDRSHGIKLYVRRVFITDDNKSLLPSYLRFMRGVIDADDLPLNVSRELLQHNRQLDTIRSAAVKKILGLLEGMVEKEPEKYQVFWREFGRAFKEGVAEDFANRERIAPLLRFTSTQSATNEQDVSLADYVARMKEGQDKIYFITAESLGAARSSPHLEALKDRGVEVLLMTDPVDEWVVAQLNEFDGKTLQSVAKGDFDLGALTDAGVKQAVDDAAVKHHGLLERMKSALGEKVKDVRASYRLRSSPSCVVVEENDMAVGLQNVLKAAGHSLPPVIPVLEINVRHPLVERLDREQDSERFRSWTQVLLDQAILSEGGQIDDPAGYVQRVNELLLEMSGGDRKIIL